MKNLIQKIMSIALTTMMALSLAILPAGASITESGHTDFTYSANGVIQQAANYTVNANGVSNLSATNHYDAQGRLSYVDSVEKGITQVYHYNAATGNVDSIDFVQADSNGNNHYYTQYTVSPGVNVVVDRGSGASIASTGISGGSNNYTAAQIESAYQQVLAGSTWKDLGYNISSVSITGNAGNALTDAQLSRVLGYTTTGTGTTTTGTGIDYQSNGQTNYLCVSGQIYYYQGGHIYTVHNQDVGTYTDSSFVIDASRYGGVKETVTLSNGHLYDSSHTDVGMAGDNTVIIGGNVYTTSGGKLYASNGSECGTLTAAGAWSITTPGEGQMLLGDAQSIRAAMAANPGSTFSFTFDSNNRATSYSYYSNGTTHNCSISANTTISGHSVDPLVTGQIQGVSVVTDKNGVAHYYAQVSAGKVDMFDGNGQQSADGETIMVEVNAETAASLENQVGQEITIAGNVTASADGHLSMTMNEGGYQTGAAGTTYASWLSSNQSFYNSMVTTMIAVYNNLGVGNASWQSQWHALEKSTGPNF